MADAAIPLQFHNPTIESPADAQARALSLQQQGMSLQQMAQTQQMNAVKLQEERAKAVTQAQDQQAIKDIQDAFTANGGDYDKTRAAIVGKVPMRHVQQFDTDHLQVARGLLEMGKAKRDRLNQDHELIGNELMAIKQTPVDLRSQAAIGARSRLASQGVDVSQIPENPPTDDQSLDAMIAQVGYARQAGQIADQQAQEEQRRETAKRAASAALLNEANAKRVAVQQKKEQAASSHLGVTNQDQHAEWMAGLDPEIASQYKNLRTFNEDTQNAIQNMALSADQRGKASDRQVKEQADLERAAVAGGPAGLATRANDPTLTPQARASAQRAFDMLTQSRIHEQTANSEALDNRFDRREAAAARKEMVKDQNTHGSLQRQEQDQWAIHGRLGALIQAATKSGDEKVKDPKSGRDISIDEAKQLYSAAEAKAQNLQEQAKEIRSRNQWGEFGPHNAPAAAPAAAPAGAPPAAAAPAQQGAPVKGQRFKNAAGQILRFDGNQFIDEKTGKPYQQ